MKLSIIVPVHNGGDDLRRCLQALRESPRAPDQLIAVDDASTDRSGAVARDLGAHVVRLDGEPHGPACARNRGAEVAQGDVLVFIDADVAVHGDTLARVERCLTDHPEVTALFGSYDDDPPARTLVSRYKNLQHHFVHQHGKREASTFWAGCGAIRRDVFNELGGFDERYGRPCVEDIELGARLRHRGYVIWLCPEIQVTHLKQWAFAGLLRADILNRAVPWTWLMMREEHVPADLNVDVASRLSAVLAWGSVVFGVAGFWSAWCWIGSVAALLAVGVLNRRLYRFFAGRGTPLFAAGAIGLHWLYLLYSSATFGVVAALSRVSLPFGSRGKRSSAQPS
jgi:GT2 family glycosyltransferase